MKAFRNVRKVEMVDIPALKEMILRLAFVDVKELKMENASLLENHEKLGVIKRKQEEERLRKEKEKKEQREKGIVLNAEDLESLSVELKSIDVKKCEDYQNEVLDLSRFTELEALTIGDGCFNYVSKVSVVGLKKLKSVVIGAKSFQNESNDSELVVSGCPELTSLSVGNESFKGFKEMKLSGLDGLKGVVMGGNCFKNAELRVSGLKGLETLSLGAGCFEKSLHSVIEGERGCVV